MTDYVCEHCGKEREQLKSECSDCYTDQPYAASTIELCNILGRDWRKWFVGDWFSTAPLGGHDSRWFVQGGLLSIYEQLGYDTGDSVAYIWGYDREKNISVSKRPFYKNRGVWWTTLKE